jgi:hypothetical protein
VSDWLSVPQRLLHLPGVHVGSDAPSSPLTHHWWVDTSSKPWLLKVWDQAEDEWVTVGAAGGGGSVAVDDNGQEVTAEASRLNFGTGLSVTDDGGGEVTIDATGGGAGAGAYDEVVGDGTEVTFDVEHGLGTSAVVVAAWEVSSGERLTPAMLILNDDEVRVTFSSAPDPDDARVVVLASGGANGETEVDRVQYHPSSSVASTVSTSSLTAIDTTNLRLVFTAPSAEVVVSLTALAFAAGGGNELTWSMLDGASEVTNATARVALSPSSSSGSNQFRVTHRFIVDGLTPGVEYTWDWAQARTGGSGTVGTGYGGALGAALMEVSSA